MSGKLSMALIVIGFLFFITDIYLLKKDKISIKMGVVYLLPTMFILLIGIVPDIFIWGAKFFGFKTISNLLIGILFVSLIFIIFSLSVMVSSLNKKVILLIQEISIMKKQIEEKK